MNIINERDSVDVLTEIEKFLLLGIHLSSSSSGIDGQV